MKSSRGVPPSLYRRHYERYSAAIDVR